MLSKCYVIATVSAVRPIMLNIVQTNPLNNLTAQIGDRRIKHRQSH